MTINSQIYTYYNTREIGEFYREKNHTMHNIRIDIKSSLKFKKRSMIVAWNGNL